MTAPERLAADPRFTALADYVCQRCPATGKTGKPRRAQWRTTNPRNGQTLLLCTQHADIHLGNWEHLLPPDEFHHFTR